MLRAVRAVSADSRLDIVVAAVPEAAPTVLVVADPADVGELERALAEPLPSAVGKVEVIATTGGDDTIDTFEARKPPVVVVCASLKEGDTASLLEALRGMVASTELAVVIVGDREGAQSIATGVTELRPDGFVARPIIGKALRYAVANALEKVLKVKGVIPASTGTAPGTDPGAGEVKAIQRARWEALADSLVADPEDTGNGDEASEAAPLPPQPAAATNEWTDPSPPAREPTLILPDVEPPPATASTSSGSITLEIPLPTLDRMRSETAPTSEIPLPTLDRMRSESAAPNTERTRAESNPPPTLPRTRTGDEEVAMIERASNGTWSDPKSPSFHVPAAFRDLVFAGK